MRRKVDRIQIHTNYDGFQLQKIAPCSQSRFRQHRQQELLDGRRFKKAMLYLMRPFKSYWTELAGRPTAQVRIKELNDKLSIVLFICYNRYLLKYFPWPQIDPRYNKRRLILKSLIKIRFLAQNFHMYQCRDAHVCTIEMTSMQMSFIQLFEFTHTQRLILE